MSDFERTSTDFLTTRIGSRQQLQWQQCHHHQGKLYSFFWVYTNVYVPVKRACVTVVPNCRNDIEGWGSRHVCVSSPLNYTNIYEVAPAASGAFFYDGLETTGAEGKRKG